MNGHEQTHRSNAREDNQQKGETRHTHMNTNKNENKEQETRNTKHETGNKQQ